MTREKYINIPATIKVHCDGEWCALGCQYLDNYEPRCFLKDVPLMITKGLKGKKHFTRCNECLGKPR